MKLIAAVAQTATVLFDTAATAGQALALMAEAAARGAQLLVFPEAYVGSYPKGAAPQCAVVFEPDAPDAAARDKHM